MKTPKTQECINTLVAVAFGNKNLDSKELDTAVREADNELNELKRLASYQEPKKLDVHIINRINGTYDRYLCPTCGSIITFNLKYVKYCVDCGQRLDWEDYKCE